MSKFMRRFTSSRGYSSNARVERFEEACRMATAKTLIRPDEATNQLVLNMINEDPIVSGISARDVVDVLKWRLKMENPHKQWLAIILLGKVLYECQARIGIHLDELLHSVAVVLKKPSRRGPEEAQRRAREAAQQLLETYLPTVAHGAAATLPGPSGYVNRPRQLQQQQPVQGPGAGANYTREVNRADREARLMADVKEQVDAAKNLCDLLQEMTVSRSEDRDPQMLGELIAQAMQVNGKLEPMLGELSAIKTGAAERLMASALKVTDELESASTLAQEAQLSGNAPEGQENTDAAPADAQPMIDLLGDLDAPAPAPAPAAADPFADTFAPLQQAADPFAASEQVSTAAAPADPFRNGTASAAADPFALAAPAPAPAPTTESAAPYNPFAVQPSEPANAAPQAFAPPAEGAGASATTQAAQAVPGQFFSTPGGQATNPADSMFLPALPMGQQQAPPQPQAFGGQGAGSVPSANPFTAAGAVSNPFAVSDAAAGAAAFPAVPSANPFAAPGAAPTAAPVKAEVDLEFDRIMQGSIKGEGGFSAPPAAGQINADFSALVTPTIYQAQPLPQQQPPAFF